MVRPSRLPGKIVCLSLCSRSASRVRLRPFWAARAAPRLSADAASTKNIHSGVETMAAPTHNLDELRRRMAGAITALKQELGGLRTGRASAGVVDHVEGGGHGSHKPPNQSATPRVAPPRRLLGEGGGCSPGPAGGEGV